MSDLRKPECLNHHDEIETVLRNNGVNTPEMDRLARVVNDMQHIEWQLARRRHVSDEVAGAVREV